LEIFENFGLFKFLDFFRTFSECGSLRIWKQFASWIFLSILENLGSGKNSTLARVLKIQNLVKNHNFGQKSKFWSKIEILVKYQNFGQK